MSTTTTTVARLGFIRSSDFRSPLWRVFVLLCGRRIFFKDKVGRGNDIFGRVRDRRVRGVRVDAEREISRWENHFSPGDEFDRVLHIPARYERCIVLGFRELLVSVLRGRVRRCLLYTSPSPRDVEESRMPSSA